MRVVDARTGMMVEGYLGAGHMAIAALPDRDVFVWGEVSGNLVAYDMSERREIACISVSGDSVSAIAINPAGDRIAASSMPNSEPECIATPKPKVRHTAVKSFTPRGPSQ